MQQQQQQPPCVRCCAPEKRAGSGVYQDEQTVFEFYNRLYRRELVVLLATAGLGAVVGVAYALWSTESRRRAGLPVPARGIGSYWHAGFTGLIFGVTLATISLLLYRTLLVRFPKRTQSGNALTSPGTPLLPMVSPLPV